MTQTHYDFGWLTKDGTSIVAQGWMPESDPRAVLCLVHGLGEHTGRYQHVAQRFATDGFVTMGHDQRGHGRSGGRRGYAPSLDAWLDDIEHLLTAAGERFPGVPRLLYGHSMGGAWVLSYALRRHPAIAGVIATSPLVQTATKPPAAQMALAKLMCRVAPTFTMANGLDLNALSRDSAVVKAYIEDPLVHDRLTARLGIDMLQAGAWSLEHAAEFPLDLLLVQGSADRIVSPSATNLFAKRAGQRCTLKTWEGLFHETHNEPEKAKVLAFTSAWIAQRLA